MPERRRALEEGREALVEQEQRGVLAALAAAASAYWVASDDLPVPAGPRRRVLVPRAEPAAEQGVERRQAALHRLAGVRAVVLGGDEPGEDLEPAAPDDEVVVAAAERPAAQLA